MRAFALLACMCLAGCSQTAPVAAPEHTTAETDPFRTRLAAFLDEASAAAVMIDREPDEKVYKAQANTVELAFAKLPEKPGTEKIREVAGKLVHWVHAAFAWVGLCHEEKRLEVMRDIAGKVASPDDDKRCAATEAHRRECAVEVRQRIAALRKMAELP